VKLFRRSHNEIKGEWMMDTSTNLRSCAMAFQLSVSHHNQDIDIRILSLRAACVRTEEDNALRMEGPSDIAPETLNLFHGGHGTHTCRIR